MPMFAPDHRSPTGQPAYYSAWREPRLPSEAARREGPRSGYIGSEVFVSLVDPEEAERTLALFAEMAAMEQGGAAA